MFNLPRVALDSFRFADPLYLLAAGPSGRAVRGVGLAPRPAPRRSEANAGEACAAGARAARRRRRSRVLGGGARGRVAVHRRARAPAGAGLDRSKGQRRHRGAAGRVGIDVRLRRAARPVAAIGAVPPDVCRDAQLAGRPRRARALRATRGAAGATDEGSQRALLLHRSPRRQISVHARERDDVGHQYRGGHPLGPATRGEGRRGLREERKSESLSRDLRRPVVERHRGHRHSERACHEDPGARGRHRHLHRRHDSGTGKTGRHAAAAGDSIGARSRVARAACGRRRRRVLRDRRRARPDRGVPDRRSICAGGPMS